MADNARKGIETLRDIFKYDPTVQRRIDGDLAAFRRYIDRRSEHVALSRVPSSEYDPDAVKAADNVRTECHNAAILAARDLNTLCELASIDPIAPVCDPSTQFSNHTHRAAVARFIADALELTAEERHACNL